MSKILFLAFAMVGASASATSVNMADLVVRSTQNLVSSFAVHAMARYTVGDTANYDLTVGNNSGTMVITVTAASATSVTLDQKVDLGAMGTNDVVEVMNPSTGQITSVTTNGQSQTPPDPNDQQITSQQLATITVPAGTFKCQDVVVHMKSENTDTEMWVDSDDIPAGSMLKMTTTQQGQAIEADLTSFTKVP